MSYMPNGLTDRRRISSTTWTLIFIIVVQFAVICIEFGMLKSMAPRIDRLERQIDALSK